MSLANENDINNVIIPGTTGIIEALQKEANDGLNFKDYLIGTRRVMNIAQGRIRGIPLEKIINNKYRIPSSKGRLNQEIDRPEAVVENYKDLVR